MSKRVSLQMCMLEVADLSHKSNTASDLERTRLYYVSEVGFLTLWAHNCRQMDCLGFRVSPPAGLRGGRRVGDRLVRGRYFSQMFGVWPSRLSTGVYVDGND